MKAKNVKIIVINPPSNLKVKTMLVERIFPVFKEFIRWLRGLKIIPVFKPLIILSNKEKSF